MTLPAWLCPHERYRDDCRECLREERDRLQELVMKARGIFAAVTDYNWSGGPGDTNHQNSRCHSTTRLEIEEWHDLADSAKEVEP